MNGLKISSIQFTYDSNMEVKGYNVSVDGVKGDIKSFGGTVYLSAEDVDLKFLEETVLNKIKETL